jgi:hypothetical protein
VEFAGDRVAHWGRYIFEHFGFSLLITISPMLYTHLSSGAGTTGPSEAALPKRLSLTALLQLLLAFRIAHTALNSEPTDHWLDTGHWLIMDVQSLSWFSG